MNEEIHVKELDGLLENTGHRHRKSWKQVWAYCKTGHQGGARFFRKTSSLYFFEMPSSKNYRNFLLLPFPLRPSPLLESHLHVFLLIKLRSTRPTSPAPFSCLQILPHRHLIKTEGSWARSMPRKNPSAANPKIIVHQFGWAGGERD